MKYIYSFFSLLFIMTYIFTYVSCKDSVHRSDVNASLIDLSNPVKQELNMSEFIEEIRYIALETLDENLIGNIDQLLFADNKIIVVDRLTSSVFIFTDKGKFLNKISRQGAGPEEYVKINKAAIDSQKKLLYILDRQKVYVYTLDGTYVKSFKINFWADDFICTESGTLVFYSTYGHNGNLKKDDKVPLLAVYDIATSKEFYSIYKNYSITPTEVIDYHMLTKYPNKNEATLTLPLSDYIFQLSPNDISPKYLVDFGKENYQKKLRHIELLKEERLSAKDCLEGGKGFPDFWEIQGCLESDSVLFIGYNNYAEHATGIFLQDKRNGHTIEGYTQNQWVIKNDMDGVYPLLPIALRETEFYTVVPAALFLEKTNQESVLEGIAGKINEEDNPILMITKLNIK